MKNENQTFEQTLHHGNFIVRDHHVHDVRTLPGVTLLDMIYRLASNCVGTNAIELRRVVFKQPIVTSEQFDKKILVTFTPVDAHWRVSVSSYKVKDNRPLDDTRYDNMECLLFPLSERKPPRQFDVGRFIREAEHRIDMGDIYRLVAQPVNIKHYSFMKTLGTVYSRNNAELMQLHLSDEAERFREKFHAHPAFLDGSTFAGQSVRLRNKALADDNTPYIPFTVDRFCIYQPLPRTIFTYSENEAFGSGREGAAPDVVATDVAIFNEAGELLVEFERFTMKRIRSAHLIKMLIEDVQGGASDAMRPVADKKPAAVFSPGGAPAGNPGPASVAAYIQEKVAGVLRQPPGEISLGDNFYDLGMDSTQLLWLTKELEETIGKELYPTLLFEYSSIEKLAEYLSREFNAGALLKGSAQATIDAAPVEVAATRHAETHEESDRKVLLFAPLQATENLPAAQAGAAPRRHVVFVAGSRPSAAYSAVQTAIGRSANIETVVPVHPAGEVIAEQIEDMLVQVVAFIKELVSQPATDEVLVQLLADAPAGRSWSAMFSGCFKTMSMEHPRIRSQVILIEELSSQPPEEIALLLQREAASASKGAACISYSKDLKQRQIGILQEVDYRQASRVGLPFRNGGVYVIAGGLGGLGFIVADHLAANCKPNLVLLGRSPLDNTGLRKVSQLIQKGAEVLYLQTDLTSLASVEEAFRAVRTKFGQVNGIVHSAGIIKDQVIGRKNIGEIKSVAGPKISGLWHLDHVSSQDKLDFFMVFSSLSAITGNVGQVDYASANAFMDAFSLHRQDLVRRGQRFGDTININWPLWAEGGMAIDKGVERLMYQSTGLQPLPTDVGLEIIEWALQNKATQIAVTFGKESKIRNYIGPRQPALPAQKSVLRETQPSRKAESETHAESRSTKPVDIAIIGIAGRYPQAGNIGEFYRNLQEGRNCITPVPKERWDGYDFGYDIDDYYRFGGFIDRIDTFDPLLFGLPPVRAQSLDPQARLFLETAWEACEDAGFHLDRTKQHYRGSSDSSVGVFVGAFWSHYELFGSENTVRGMPTAMGISLSSISNMTSYCMNFHGPSVAVDTMCSSALTSIHMACESIRRNECHYAIAGGVNLLTHPHKFIFLKENNFLSSEGVCRSFGENGDGYVPGEGVGAVLLTTLDRAISMGYPIRAVIKGSSINHCGKTSGGTVPNPIAQAEVIADALTAAGVDPRTVSYVEAHGTGTALGDPIEIKGLAKAFGRWTDETQYCAIGSSKSNIGHLEAAAGIAGLTKLVLQLEHGEIFPSLHAEKLNPLIPFQTTPFYVERDFRNWERPEVEIDGDKKVYPRRALISSFGASGSNACVVVEEYVDQTARSLTTREENQTAVGIVLSARDANRLIDQARRLLVALRRGELLEGDLPSVAYTLQVGREAMDERLAITVESLHELEQKLQRFVDGDTEVENLCRGRVKRNNPTGALYSSDEARMAELNRWIAEGDYPVLLKLWVEGVIIDWNRLYSDGAPRRVHLPTYSFARDRYWIPAASVSAPALPKKDSEEQTIAARSPEVAVPIASNPVPAESNAVPAVRREAPSTAGVRAKSVLLSVNQIPKHDSENRGMKRVALSPLSGDAAAPATTLSQVATPKEEPPSADFQIGSAPAQADTTSLAVIQQALSASLAKALFIEPSEIDPDAPFTDVGLDSIIAVQWMKAINSEFGLSLKATVLYDHSSIRALSAHIGSELRRSSDTTVDAPVANSVSAAEIVAETDYSVSAETVPAPATLQGPPVEKIKESLTRSLAKTLFMDVEEIGHDMQFIEFGMDSIIAVQWIKTINQEFSSSLKATILYEHPTIQSLAEHLHAELGRAPTVDKDEAFAAETGAPSGGTIKPGAGSSASTSPVETFEENFRYALNGCGEAKTSLVEVSPGFHLEVFSIGEGVPVVLMPPMGALATVWMYQIRELSKKYRVLVFHYPGHGNSNFNKEHATFDRIASGVTKTLDVFGIREPMHLVGWSMGALISERIALNEPIRIKSLTLIGTPAKVEDGGSTDSTIMVLGNLASDFVANVPASAMGAPESNFDFIRAPLSMDVSMPYLNETLNFDYTGAAGITSETLIVFGGKDQVIAPEHGLMLWDEIVNSRHVRLDEGGHYVPLQNHEWFNRRLLGFFDEMETKVDRRAEAIAE